MHCCCKKDTSKKELRGPRGPRGKPGTSGGSSILPKNILFSNANLCDYYIRQGDGIVLNRFASTPSPSGAFNGAGQGNKCLLSIKSFGGQVQGIGKTIADLEYIDVTYRTARNPAFSTSNNLYLNLFVKNVPGSVWTPSPTGDCIIVVSNNPAGIQNPTGTFTTAHLSRNDEIWSIVGNSSHGLPSFISGSGASLDNYSPSTDTLFDGIVTDNGLPSNYQYGAIGFVSGDSNDVSPTSVVIREIKLKFLNSPEYTYSFY